MERLLVFLPAVFFPAYWYVEGAEEAIRSNLSNVSCRVGRNIHL